MLPDFSVSLPNSGPVFTADGLVLCFSFAEASSLIPLVPGISLDGVGSFLGLVNGDEDPSDGMLLWSSPSGAFDVCPIAWEAVNPQTFNAPFAGSFLWLVSPVALWNSATRISAGNGNPVCWVSDDRVVSLDHDRFTALPGILDSEVFEALGVVPAPGPSNSGWVVVRREGNDVLESIPFAPGTSVRTMRLSV